MGVALVVGVLRILKGWPIHRLIIGGYILVVAMTAVAPREIIGIAYDSGGVTTSTITVPLVTALGVGLASSIRGRQSGDRRLRPDRLRLPDTHDLRDALRDPLVMDLFSSSAGTFLGTIRDVLPIVSIILAFQVLVLRRPVKNLKRVLLGFLFVLIGLSLFLIGLERTLFPLGRLMAEQLTAPDFIASGILAGGASHWNDYYWVYLFAFTLGFATTIAEPALIAVAIKANEVTAGAIRVRGLRVAVALGVAIGITLGVWRIVVGPPIHWFIIAGYLVVVVQTRFAPRIIVPLAYDSGGVTTSTVTVPLVAALGIGLAESVPGRSPLIDGFGLIAFASVFPIMTVMAYAQLSELKQWLISRRTP